MANRTPGPEKVRAGSHGIISPRVCEKTRKPTSRPSSLTLPTPLRAYSVEPGQVPRKRQGRMTRNGVIPGGRLEAAAPVAVAPHPPSSGVPETRALAHKPISKLSTPLPTHAFRRRFTIGREHPPFRTDDGEERNAREPNAENPMRPTITPISRSTAFSTARTRHSRSAGEPCRHTENRPDRAERFCPIRPVGFPWPRAAVSLPRLPLGNDPLEGRKSLGAGARPRSDARWRQIRR